MIKYNNNTINDWDFGTSNIVKVYRNNAVCYYKVVAGETAQTPCYAVVDDITQYQDTEFENVYNKADGKWYKLNNLNAYEEYGVYGSGRTITTYEGKLTIDGDYEYIYSGDSWVNLGEVSGSTATLPNKSFVLNYNAKDYDGTTHSIPYTSGQSKAVNAIQNYGTNTIVDHSSDGYISVTSDTRLTISGGTTPMYRTNTETGCTMTIVSKARTTANYSILTCRNGYGDNMNWMWRYPSNGIFLHGSSSYNSVTYYTTTSASPITASVRVSWNGSVQQQINDWTNNGSYSGAFQYGSYQTVNNNGSLFCDYLASNEEFWKGDFYWVYMSQEVLTDEEIQQVIAYNESSGGTLVYPLYYAEMQDPPNNVSFSSMTEAEEYECPWVGMVATIDGDKYIFSGDSTSGYEWVYKASRLPQGYTEVEYLENSSYVTNTQSTTRFNVIGDSASGNIYTIIYDMEDDGGSHYMHLFGNNVNIFMQKITQNWADKCIYLKYYGLTVYAESTPLDTKAMIEMNSSNVIVTNITASTSTTNTYGGSLSNVNETHYGVFCCYNNGDSGAHSMVGKIYEIKIESSTHVLKNNYIPCYRDSDNKVGLYDIVGGAFYYDESNELTLSVGPEV